MTVSTRLTTTAGGYDLVVKDARDVVVAGSQQAEVAAGSGYRATA